MILQLYLLAHLLSCQIASEYPPTSFENMRQEARLSGLICLTHINAVFRKCKPELKHGGRRGRSRSQFHAQTKQELKIKSKILINCKKYVFKVV